MKIFIIKGMEIEAVSYSEAEKIYKSLHINMDDEKHKNMLSIINIDIENYIYSLYPAKKQNQDEKWVSSYTTKLKASGVEDLELKIVNKAKAFFLGGTFEEMLEDVDDTQKPYFKKLIKVAIRTEWAELCVMEGKKAIQEDREPNYPPFPNI